MSTGNLIMDQKYVVKLESETFWGLSHGIVNGTLKVFKEGVVFLTNDTASDMLANIGFGTSVNDAPVGMLIIPIQEISSARKNSFRVGFMQHSLHIHLKNGKVLMFRMQPAQADRLALEISNLLGS